MSDVKNYIGFKAWGLGYDAHLTLIYTGDLSDQQVTELRTLLLKTVPSTFYSLAKRLEFAMFGPKHDVPVIKVECIEEVIILRESLLSYGVPNPSEWGWNPHITLQLTPEQPLVIPSIFKLSHLDVY